jgi:hypothetical protein
MMQEIAINILRQAYRRDIDAVDLAPIPAQGG